MPDELTFWMGKHEARFPIDRWYASNHVWLLPLETGSNTYRVGLTGYSVRLLLDVYFLTWNVPAGTTVTERQEIGEIESSKAVSGLYAPADGAIVAFNGQLLDDPSAINADSYGAGWLYDFRSDARFLTTQEYVDLLAAGWENTQRMLKGQMNR